jgi:hypothetical protein
MTAQSSVIYTVDSYHSSLYFSFEKIISDKHQGEIVYLVLKDLINKGELFEGESSAAFDKLQAFSRRRLGTMEGWYVMFNNYTIFHIVRILTWRAWRCVELPVVITKMAWIRVLDLSSCYECAAPYVVWVERKSTRLRFYKAQDWSELKGRVHKEEWPLDIETK